jgi:hypothetical protein
VVNAIESKTIYFSAGAARTGATVGILFGSSIGRRCAIAA